MDKQFGTSKKKKSGQTNREGWSILYASRIAAVRVHNEKKNTDETISISRNSYGTGSNRT